MAVVSVSSGIGVMARQELALRHVAMVASRLRRD
jgi:hypothetical protein